MSDTMAEWLKIDQEYCKLYCEQVPLHVQQGTEAQRAEYTAQQNSRERALLERLRTIFPDHPWCRRLEEL